MAIEDAFRIRATASATLERARVLKAGETFGIFDRFGDVQSVGEGPQGVYLAGTRHLSRFALLVENQPPLFLTSTVRTLDSSLVVDLTNPDTSGRLRDSLAADSLLIRRYIVLLDGGCFESIGVRNHAQAELDVTLTLLFACDYADVFEVRGTRRKARGSFSTPRVERDTVYSSYTGLDGKRRGTVFRFQPTPWELRDDSATFKLRIGAGQQATLSASILFESPDCRDAIGSITSFTDASAEAARRAREAREGRAEVTSSNELFNVWLARSFDDLYSLTTETDYGPYPYAGVPWFSAPFGRDGLITAFQCLWLEPSLAKGVLRYLAAHQATEVDPTRDALPGKILHERRRGEMADLGEIPFGRYYGSIDSTPLFVHLMGEYVRRTGDERLLEALFPAVERALRWVRQHDEHVSGPFLAYARQSADGLINQGWKDSGDALFHADGTSARAPVALCEVQGYTYAAYQSAAFLAELLGHADLARECRERAERLRVAFDAQYWCGELGTFAMALDGSGKPCRVRSSNAGHCLWSGIVHDERVPALARTLMSSTGFSGWGIRTVAEGEARYNPLAYHNGSVWPHDTSLIAMGLARYGEKQAALQLLSGLFDAARKFELFRLPEVFCGLPRTRGGTPTPYPVACAPQAWASASVFLLVQAVLGVSIDARQGLVQLDRPMLPAEVDHLEVRRLGCGNGSVDLVFNRYDRDVGVEITRRTGDVRVVIIK
jgi:glycogen debranching enzyme